ncbi:MAG: hypothetical protein ACE5KR_02100, partial [Candidatus Bipolaricaulia bacterium]
MRRIVWLSIALSLLLGVTAVGDKGPLTVAVHEREGYQDIEIQTRLSNYILSTEGGELKSAFLHFAPYGLRKEELVADTTTDPTTLARDYVAGGVFPFTLELPGLEGPWEYRLLEQEARLVRVEFTKAVGDLKIKKIYTIRDDPSYTVGLKLVLSNGGAEELSLDGFKLLLGTNLFQVTLKKFVEGDLRYLFDGQRTGSVPESYEYFEGLGTVTKAAVLFLQNQVPGLAP